MTTPNHDLTWSKQRIYQYNGAQRSRYYVPAVVFSLWDNGRRCWALWDGDTAMAIGKRHTAYRHCEYSLCPYMERTHTRARDSFNSGVSTCGKLCVDNYGGCATFGFITATEQRGWDGQQKG
jgi:hypothetical protein